MSGLDDVQQAGKQERTLIKAEEKAGRAFLKARAKHEKLELALAAIQVKTSVAAETLNAAERTLLASQRARALGPSENAKPAGE